MAAARILPIYLKMVPLVITLVLQKPPRYNVALRMDRHAHARSHLNVVQGMMTIKKLRGLKQTNIV